MKPYNAFLNHEFAYNPCLGCTSAACAYCEYSTDRRDWSNEPDKRFRTRYFRLSAKKSDVPSVIRSGGTAATAFVS